MKNDDIDIQNGDRIIYGVNTVKEEKGIAYGDPHVTQQDPDRDSDEDDDLYGDTIEL